MATRIGVGRQRKGIWHASPLVLATTIIASAIAFIVFLSFLTRHVDPNGCNMAYMWPSFAKFSDFDGNFNRFASKYSLFLYREGGIDEDTRVKGVPVLFVPGNAGRYTQARSYAAEAARSFDGVIKDDPNSFHDKVPFDFFVVDFNEEFTAFDGRTLLDQAEYVNDAIDFILSLYSNPQRALRPTNLPQPSSVIILGHSMGGIVARASFLLPNHRQGSINTIVTLAAPHARPPVSFDQEMVRTYRRINNHWLHAYTQASNENNPLADVVLISVAGGAADTMIPSDYAAISSFVPPIHGFAVFTSTIPHTWAGTDHLAITWCDQLRKSIVRALFEVADAREQTQTVSVPQRMKSFRKWLLSGMEDGVEKTGFKKEPSTIFLHLDEPALSLEPGKALNLRELRSAGKTAPYLFQLPAHASLEHQTLTLLTNEALYETRPNSSVKVLLCKTSTYDATTTDQSSIHLNYSSQGTNAPTFACKDTSVDVIALPASTRDTQYPFTKHPSNNPLPFSYLQYDVNSLHEYQYLAILDESPQETSSWFITDVATSTQRSYEFGHGLFNLLSSGLEITVVEPAPMMVEITLSSFYSSLLSYSLQIEKRGSSDDNSLFTPLVRLSTSDPHESKYFVNVTEAPISLHGISASIQPMVHASSRSRGLTLQVWSDPTYAGALRISLRFDLLGSMGKLWMRYRTAFAALPLLILAVAVKKQFELYQKEGAFVGFTEALDACLRQSSTAFILALTPVLGLIASAASRTSLQQAAAAPPDPFASYAVHFLHFITNDALGPFQDSFFWLLTPLFALVTVGVCVLMNFAVLILTQFFTFSAGLLSKSASTATKDSSSSGTGKSILSKGMLILVGSALLASMFFPSELVVLVLCIIQWSTSVRALLLARRTNSKQDWDLYNYTHSILMLMIWILPINIPALVVLVKNLAIRWVAPVYPFRNVISVLPFALVVGQLSQLHMIPQPTAYQQRTISLLLYLLATFALVYGIAYAFLLHHLVGALVGFLALVQIF